MTTMTIQEQAAKLVADERKRQVEVEGFDAAHDDQWTGGELAKAGAAYAVVAIPREDSGPGLKPGQGPWSMVWWKPSPDRLRNLVKAGALLMAEIERELRARGRLLDGREHNEFPEIRT